MFICGQNWKWSFKKKRTLSVLPTKKHWFPTWYIFWSLIKKIYIIRELKVTFYLIIHDLIHLDLSLISHIIVQMFALLQALAQLKEEQKKQVMIKNLNHYWPDIKVSRVENKFWDMLRQILKNWFFFFFFWILLRS